MGGEGGGGQHRSEPPRTRGRRQQATRRHIACQGLLPAEAASFGIRCGSGGSHGCSQPWGAAFAVTHFCCSVRKHCEPTAVNAASQNSAGSAAHLRFTRGASAGPRVGHFPPVIHYECAPSPGYARGDGGKMNINHYAGPKRREASRLMNPRRFQNLLRGEIKPDYSQAPFTRVCIFFPAPRYSPRGRLWEFSAGPRV